VCVPTSSEWDVACGCDLLANLFKQDGGLRLIENYDCAACICCAREKSSACVSKALTSGSQANSCAGLASVYA